MKKRLQFVLLFIGLCLVSLQLVAQTTRTITIKSNSYSPASLEIQQGDKVKFVLEGGTHPTEADNNEWPTFTLTSNDLESDEFALSVGTHTYRCTLHGNSGMTGTIIVTPVLGTKNTKTSQFGLTVSPNPFDHQINLSFTQSHPELTHIRITDLIGNEVSNINLTGNSSMEYKLDFSHLPAGVYFCNLYTAKGIVETRKLFRMK